MKIFFTVFDYLQTIFIWFIFLLSSGISLAIAYLCPNMGITALVAAIAITILSKLFKTLIRKEE